MPAMHDVVIIGGGPAGLFAGARLAAAGFRTALLEEHASVGEPVHCTGVLAADAFDEFDLSRRSLLNQLTTARFYSPAGHEVTYSGDRVEAVVIDRRAFDQDLLERATSAGVSIERGARVTGVQVDAAGVTVRTPSREHRARACILACGANYSLHRQVGFGMPRLFLHTAQLELPASRLGDVELHFGAEIAPKGFGWVVPVSRPREQCARHRRDVRQRCAADTFSAWRRASRRGGASRRPISDRPRQKILPLAPISRTYGDRLLAIGDAAGLVKPTTGGGIYYSLVSAALACRNAGRCRVAKRPERAAAVHVRGAHGVSDCQPSSRHRPGCACSLTHERLRDRTAFRPCAHRRRDADRAPHGVLQSSPQADPRLVETPSRTPAPPSTARVLKPKAHGRPQGRHYDYSAIRRDRSARRADSSAARGSPAPSFGTSRPDA